jgi:serine protease Do
MRDHSILFTHSYGWIAVLGLLFSEAAIAQTRQQKLVNDRLKFESLGTWYYNDLEKGFEEARRQKLPMLVVLRCIPCTECVKLDDDLIEADPKIRLLLEGFVRVRVITANGLDLSRFQFDTDQSFAVFLLNADGTLYGRYGTRSDRTEWKDDVSVAGLARALEGALELHRNYPANRESLQGKQAKPSVFASPEKIPALEQRYTNKLDLEGDTVKSCIHCHMIGESMLTYFRNEEKPIPSSLLFPYPHPKTLGIVFDPNTCATVKAVLPGSIGDESGLLAGDRIRALEGQPILSIADVQWVLHHLPDSACLLNATVDRAGDSVSVPIQLPNAWRSKEDTSWRASRWQMRQLGLGGMKLSTASDTKRKELGIEAGTMALMVDHVGMYAPHDRAKKAGIEKGDVVIGYDGRVDLVRESDLLVYSVTQIKVGQSVEVKIKRGLEDKVFHVSTAK